jgi:hypothetical protein
MGVFYLMELHQLFLIGGLSPDIWRQISGDRYLETDIWRQISGDRYLETDIWRQISKKADHIEQL